jgi:hypothetical protein
MHTCMHACMYACTYVCIYIYTPKGGQGAEAEGHRAGAVGHVRDGEELFKPIGFKEHQGTPRDTKGHQDKFAM